MISCGFFLGGGEESENGNITFMISCGGFFGGGGGGEERDAQLCRYLFD